jgi:autotransporter-associated beta strand protein
LTLNGSNSYTGGTTVSEGTIFVTGAGTLGNASGAITISNTASTATLDLRNAQTRTGTITMIGQGARLASGDVNNPGSLINNGSALEMGGGQITVSVSGTGGLNVTGGGTINSSNSYTGVTTISGTTGWYGTDQLFVNNANALGAASGGLTISGGSVNLQGNTITRSGNVTISGGTVANGTLSKSGGNIDLQGGVVNASLAGTAGLIKSNANGASLNASNSYTGGTTISGGTLFVGGSGTLGDAGGDVTVSGTGSALTEVVLDLRNQQTRTGTITMTNQDARIITGGGGSIVNNGGAFRFGGGLLDVGVSGTGGLNVTGGGAIYSSNSYTGATTISGTTGWYGTDQLFVYNANALGAASGDLTISGGTVNLQGNTITRSGNLTISGGTVANGTFSKSGTAYDIQGGAIGTVLAGTAGLTKSGGGTATLSGSNSYTGDTSIEAGRLVVNGSLASTNVSVASGASLAGSGTLGKTTILSGGTIAPGNSPGTLTITNGLTWAGGGNYNWQIFGLSGSAGQTNTWDLIDVTAGTWDINGLSSTNKFNINLWSLSGLPDTTGIVAGFDATQNYSWKILASGGLTGTFNTNLFNINTAAVNGTGGFTGATGLFSLALDGNNDLFLNYSGGGAAVPEPGTWAAAGLLVAAAVLRRALRRKQATP